MVAPLLNQYTLLVAGWLRGFRPMQNSNGDTASPCYLLHLMVIFMIALEMAMEYPKMMHFLLCLFVVVFFTFNVFEPGGMILSRWVLGVFISVSTLILTH